MSDPTGTDELARWLRQTPSAAQGLTRGLRPLGIAFGVVRAIDQITTPWTLSIAFSGSPTQVDDVGYLVSSYAPTVGDNVVALINGSDYLVIGSQGPSAATSGGGGDGGTGITWPLAFGGDECFQPDGIANDALCIQNYSGAGTPDTGLVIQGRIGQANVSAGDPATALLMGTTGCGLQASLNITLAPDQDLDVGTGRDLNLAANGGDVNITATGTAALAGDGVVLLQGLAGGSSLQILGFHDPGTLGSPGQLALWLDDTPGSVAVKFRATDSASANVTGALGAPIVPDAWSSAITYPSGAIVSGSDFAVYVSNVGSNLNHDPTTDAGVHWDAAGGGAGVSWPLSYSGDMGFRPDSAGADIVTFSTTGNGIFVDGTTVTGVSPIGTTDSSGSYNFAVNDSNPGHESGPTVAIANRGADLSFQVAGASAAQLQVGPLASGVVGFVLGDVSTVPADSDLGNSQVAFWLDDTPGLTFLKIKAKDSGGTVRTASIALT